MTGVTTAAPGQPERGAATLERSPSASPTDATEAGSASRAEATEPGERLEGHMPLLELVGLAGLIMVVTVCLLDIMRSSWLLIPAMAVHAGLTVMIVGYCWKMASGGFADNSPTPRTAPTSAQHDCDDRPSRDDATETSAAQRAA